LDYQYKGQD